MNDQLMEIISLKNTRRPGPLDVKSQYLFSLALYDLDTFREQVFENGILDHSTPEPALMEQARKDDVVLLTVGIEWIKGCLFNAGPKPSQTDP